MENEYSYLMNDKSVPVYLDKSEIFYVMKIDLRGNHTYVNNYFKLAFDVYGKDLIGDYSLNYVHPDDMDKCRRAGYDCLSNPGKSINLTLCKPFDSNENFYTEWEFNAILNSKKEPIGILAIGYDISEYQYRLNFILNNLPEFVFIFDEAGYYLDIFCQDESLLKMPKKELIGKNIREVFEDKEELENRIQTIESIFRLGSVNNLEYAIKLNGKTYWYIMNGVLLKYRSSKTALIVSRNITEKKELRLKLEKNNQKLIHNEQILKKYILNLRNQEKELKKKAEELENKNIQIGMQNEKLNEIAFIQAHKVRGPLASIIGICNIMDQDSLNFENKKLLGLLNKCSEDLDYIIHDLVRKSEEI